MLPIFSTIPASTLIADNSIFTIIGVCFSIFVVLVGVIWKASALTNDLKDAKTAIIELRAVDVNAKAVIEAQALRLNILETNYNHVVSDVHDMKELIQKIYDKVSNWDKS